MLFGIKGLTHFYSHRAEVSRHLRIESSKTINNLIIFVCMYLFSFDIIKFHKYFIGC